ncbi:MAG: hypothetical protein EOM26_02290 [Alphaproteobacteria bacterium]|nr:hypothetical protein [Alphaproteobacteria bacterium]
MISTAHAYIALDKSRYEVPGDGAQTALTRLVGQKVIDVEATGKDELAITFSNGAVLTFVFKDPIDLLLAWATKGKKGAGTPSR